MGEILGGRGTPPTAVCACNDTVALGAMEGAKRDGVEVPEGMSFIGFDDTEQSRQCTPPLSTVSVDSPLMARLAVETLFSFRAGGNPGPIRTLVPARLLLRESVRDLLSGDNTETRRILQ